MSIHKAYTEMDLGFCNLTIKYRVFNPIIIDNGNEKIHVYGPYPDSMLDTDSWQEVVNKWTPEARIFGRLPIAKQDINRVIPGKTPYLIVLGKAIEKVDKPFGYGQSDYFEINTFKNVDKREAMAFLESLLANKINQSCHNVGLELTISDDELRGMAERENRRFDYKVRKFFRR